MWGAKTMFDIQCLHRARERLVKSRTALSNEIRGLLNEYGIIFPKNISRLELLLSEFLQQDNQLTSMARSLFKDLFDELKSLSGKIKQYNQKIESICKSHPVCRRISTVPGVGPITATAMVAAISDPYVFKNGRQVSAWLGLVPRQSSSGGKDRLLGISKRGDNYLRKILIHGGRSCVLQAKREENKRNNWINKLVERRGANRAAVAVANKNARIIWALIAKEEEFKLEI